MAEYRNPQADGGGTGGGGDKRMLMVFAVTFALIIIAQIFLFKKKPETQQPSTAATQTAQSSQPSAQTPAQASSAPVNQPGTAKPVEAKAASSEVETVVENDFYSIVFTNRGAVVKSWILKKYKDDDGKPLDLVNSKAAKFGFPLSLFTYDENLRNQINSALYVASASGNIAAPGELNFEYASGDTAVHKSFVFGDTYVISIETSVTHNGQPVQAYPMWPAALGDEATAPAYASQKIEYMADGKVERIAIKKVSGGNTVRGPFNWAGPQDQFFAAIFLPDNPDTAVMVTLHDSITRSQGSQESRSRTAWSPTTSSARPWAMPRGVTRERLFVGPKALNVLESVRSNTAPGQMDGPDLRDVVDFGFFHIVARPLFLWLKWTHEHMASNWGVSIIILTVIINLALLPLRITSMKSALKMQKLQPQMKAIQERYKKLPMRDPKRQEMNAEIGELYKREGVNPAGGCLPLIDPDAVPVGVLHHAGQRYRAAPGAVSLAARSVVAGQAVHHAGADRRQHIPDAEDDAQLGHGSQAAADDDPDDAADDRLVQLQSALGPQRVLDHRKYHRHRFSSTS